jgi:hypothetical protein
MKNQWYRLIFLVVIILLPGCGDKDDDSATSTFSPAASETNYSGYYEVNSSCTFNNCEVAPSSLPDDVIINIEGSNCTFGGIQGSWDRNKKTAVGTNDEYCSDLTYNCMLCQEMSYDIKFSDLNHFNGDVYWYMDLSPECYSNDCHYHYSIQGVRKTTSEHYESGEPNWSRRIERNIFKGCKN